MQKDLKSYLRAIFEAPDISAARHILNLTLEVFSTKAPRAMDILEEEASDHKRTRKAESGDKAERTRDPDIS
jgi:hypothetical protein